MTNLELIQEQFLFLGEMIDEMIYDVYMRGDVSPKELSEIYRLVTRLQEDCQAIVHLCPTVGTKEQAAG